MSLQNQFFDFINEEVKKYYPSWSIKPTQQWYNCYAQVDGTKRVIIWVKLPNKDGTFWVFISISSDDILSIPNLSINGKDARKYYINFLNSGMAPLEVLDRGLTAKNPWEKNWPVGIKIRDKSQFSLIRNILTLQWDKQAIRKK